ncbi:MAG TPA: iron ABC transporter permease [Dehalococcoidia bacterium]|nr:iron ABC transporter permease [Dehalococcoidia bacterium]
MTAAVLLSPAYLVLRAAESGAIWELLSQDTTVKALVRTLWLTVAVTFSSAVVAVPLAWLTVRTDLPFRDVLSALLALPLAIPSFVGGFVTVSALGPGGMLQDVLSPFGVERLPSLYGFKGSWLTLTFLSYPYIYLPVRAALKRADPALEEASRSLGKTAFETFRRVNLPQLRPATSAGAILLALYVLSEFGAVSMLRYDTLTPLVYIQYTTSFDRASAAVLGLPLITLAVLFVALDGITRGQARYHAGGQRRPALMLSLGAWRWPALAVCLLVVGLGLGMPVAVIVYWLAKGLSQGESTSFLLTAVLNSARVAGVAAVLAVAASLPVAILSVRYSGWLSSLLEKASYSGQSLPGITIALSLVFFAANYLTPVYQTLGLLVFAYVVRFLPEALGACRSAMLQVSPHTEEVARGLGAGKLRVFLRVTAPQILPGMTAGALLVFLTSMKELPITLLLSPIGFNTLATQIWSSTSEAFFTQAALPSLLLVLLSGIAVMLLLRRERLEA